jgi:hypothetical protein
VCISDGGIVSSVWKWFVVIKSVLIKFDWQNVM